MVKMEQKQILRTICEKEYQVIEVNGVKLDFFDFDLALQGVSSEILYVQDLLRNKPDLVGAKHYNAMLHVTEEKLKKILSKMERPPEDELRPSEYYRKG